MSEAKKPAPQGSRSKNSKKQQNQVKQIIIMACVMAVCAGLITWTVMLMKDRFDQEAQLNEQNSVVDFFELSSAESSDPEDSEVTAVTSVGTDVTTGTSADESGSTTSDSTTATNATAPPRVTVQSVSFSKVSMTSTKPLPNHNTTAKTAHNSTTQTFNAKTQPQTQAQTTTVTHTETKPQNLVPDSVPSADQIVYNQLLALYLSAQNQGNSAYYFDQAGNGKATVVLHGSHAYRPVSEANGLGLYNRLGGTGGSDEHTWQTGAGFRLYQYDDTDRYIYYASQGEHYQVIGYYNTRTCDNVWARLHYYQLGVAWQAEYHILFDNQPDSLNGQHTEILSGTCDTDEEYKLSNDFEQQLLKELQNRGMSAGSWGDYAEVKSNQQTEINALWNKAGSYNKEFTLQAGGVYGAVGGNASVQLFLEANNSSAAATLPAGAFLSVDKDALPPGENMMPVKALVNREWISGYVSGNSVIVWSDH